MNRLHIVSAINTADMKNKCKALTYLLSSSEIMDCRETPFFSDQVKEALGTVSITNFISD